MRDITCPAWIVHQRLGGDAETPCKCGDCGSEIVHANAAHIDPDDSDTFSDYAVWCTNPKCIRHVCFECGDMECPAWAHGRKEEPDVEPEPEPTAIVYTQANPRGVPVR